MKIITGAAGGNFANQFGRAFDIAVTISAGLSAMIRKNSKESVRLRFVIQVYAQGGIVASLHSWSIGTVVAQPGDQVEMRFAMLFQAYWGGHVDNSFDKLGLLELRHRFIPAFESRARQAGPVF